MVEPDVKLWEQKKFWVSVALVVCLPTAGIIGFTTYRNHQPARLTHESKEVMSKGDNVQAALLAKRALEINQTYAPACEIMAEVFEKERNPDAVKWREQAARFSGNTVESLVEYASTAMRFGRKADVQTALARIGEADQRRANVQALLGAMALRTGNYTEAARFYAEAVRQEPQNAEYNFSLGSAQAMSEDLFAREAGRQILEGLAAHPEFGISAMRTLVTSYQATGESQAALRVSRKLTGAAGYEFVDKLQLLQLLRVTDDPDFQPVLRDLQRQAIQNPRDAGLLLVWMSNEGMSAEAVDWAVRRAPQIEKMPDVQPALGVCYFVLGKWPQLLKATESGNWEVVEYIRHAYRARALREQGNLLVSGVEWTMATDAATARPEAIAWLARIATEWNWPNEMEEALWKAIEMTPNARWALERLYGRFLVEKNTVGLRRVAGYLVKADPNNEHACNNFAMLSLLLRQEMERALRISKELFQKHPDNVTFASTYAFALYRANRNAEALKVLEALPQAQLENPAIATYLGIILTAMGEHEKARRYLEIARQASLLPEETELLKQATAVALANETQIP